MASRSSFFVLAIGIAAFLAAAERAMMLVAPPD
jgi:hypothetical protein